MSIRIIFTKSISSLNVKCFSFMLTRDQQRLECNSSHSDLTALMKRKTNGMDIHNRFSKNQ